MHSGKLALALVIGLLLAAVAQPARAQTGSSLPACGEALVIEDRDGDGSADFAAFECDFGDDESIQLSMFCPEGGLEKETIAERLLNPGNCTWVFSRDAGEEASLIIRFFEEDGSFVAELYDDQDGDGRVGYSIDGPRIDVTESPFWTVRMASEAPWFADDIFSFNLTLLVDGNVEVHFNSSLYQASLVNDGTPDFAIRVLDESRDGRPERDIRRLLIPRAWEYIGQVFQLMANWRDGDAPPEGATLWPYLSTAIDTTGTRLMKSATKYQPPIKVDWDEGKIVAVGEFVASRFSESNCFIYGSNALVSGSVVDPGFENPFCFYDLAEDGDGIPELSIRSGYWPSNHWGFIGGRFDYPMQSIRYSWDQDNTGGWNYGVGLAGRHEYDETITVGDYIVRSIPHDLFPTWITRREWDEAVFVEAVNGKYGSSEGIYEADVPWEVVEEYLTGFSNTHPVVEAESFLSNGLRIEYAPDLAAHVKLYFSPIDARLHLYEATEGYWKTGENERLEYRNGDGDAYIDEWRYVIDDETRQQLNWTPDYMVMADLAEQTVAIKQVAISLAAFESPVPATHAEWAALARMLESHAEILENETPKNLISRFAGPEMTISGAELKNFRRIDDGFRFELTLASNVRIVGPDLLRLSGLPPGQYVVEQRDGVFSVAPLLPAQPFIEMRQPEPGGAVQVTVGNSGGPDVPDLTLVVELMWNNASFEWLRQPVDALAGEVKSAVVSTPSRFPPGSSLTAHLEDSSGEVVVVGSPLMLSNNIYHVDVADIFNLDRFVVLIPIAILLGALLGLAIILAAVHRPEGTR